MMDNDRELKDIKIELVNLNKNLQSINESINACKNIMTHFIVSNTYKDAVKNGAIPYNTYIEFINKWVNYLTNESGGDINEQ